MLAPDVLLFLTDYRPEAKVNVETVTEQLIEPPSTNDSKNGI